ncbi:hypothetical protein KOR42_51950 [Thalassoglobus neptunius]|uniref:Uncharacterized protein n=1 Tax=Thalassoglobus neptunius TaxID=1938619 RepID=A0A5C5VAR7_9PLAN|nr:hypothetical protein [Thalassoglobus neptunius]TWT35100.1 hypothetical protein KOR42_51950 [Thalassoglobus neptunius]
MRLNRQLLSFSNLSARILILLAVLTSGCSQQLPQGMEEIRTRVLVSEEPENPITIEEARQLAAEPTEVTLIVRVGNRNFPKWFAESQAIFYVSEAFPGSDYNVDADHVSILQLEVEAGRFSRNSDRLKCGRRNCSDFR